MRGPIQLGLLRGGGILLVALGVVHLVATPHISLLIRHSVPPAAAQWLIPPMLLNHVLVGGLLIPLGALTVYAAPHAVDGADWAKVVVRITACSVAALPIALFAIMGARYFGNAPLFVVGAALAVTAAATLLVAAFSR